MGEHLAMQPASGEQVQQISERVDRKLDEIMKTITTLSSHAQPAPNIPDPSISFTGPERVPHTQLRASRAVSAPYTLPRETESSRETSPSERGASSEPGTVISPRFRRYNFAIPDLGRAPGAWRRAVKQWEEVDPITNYALRDWPKEWYEGNSPTASKRNQRKTIFEEYVRLGRDENRFISKYPDANKSLSKLLEAIRWNNGTTRSSKYGTAGERKSKSRASSETADT